MLKNVSFYFEGVEQVKKLEELVGMLNADSEQARFADPEVSEEKDKAAVYAIFNSEDAVEKYINWARLGGIRHETNEMPR